MVSWTRFQGNNLNIHVMTLFPEMFDAIKQSILGRAIKNNILSVEAVNIRDFAFNKHNKVDDYTYGGGAGMLMQAEPVYLCHKSIVESIDSSKKIRTVYLTPQGQVLNQEIAKELAKEDELILLCGHYEGIDERVLEEVVTDYISIGDYVLTGGELASMVVTDSIVRLLDGVIKTESHINDSFNNDLLDYPNYTHPEEYRGMKVPEVLLSGHHENIKKWRLNEQIKRTKIRRPDLIKEDI